MKHQVYTEVMLALVGRDANNHNIILAIALCDSEDKVNCSWFLRMCQFAGVVFDGTPVLSDRGRGLFSALSDASLGAIDRFCTRHIVGNIRATFPGAIPIDLESVVYRAQAADTSEEFKSTLGTLALTHAKIAAYIEGISADRWTMHPEDIRRVKMYGWRTTNFIESTNGAAVPARHLPRTSSFPTLWSASHATLTQRRKRVRSGQLTGEF
jgi:hypothetical protein